MPCTTIRHLPQEEQALMLAALRRARYGYLLALHVLLLWVAGRNPTAIAAFLFGSRSSVYRIVRAYQAGPVGWTVAEAGTLGAPVRTTVVRPGRQRSLIALLKAAPRTYGGCRTRWSCATRALPLHTQHGIAGSAETGRRWLHERGWVWKRAKLIAKDTDAHRVERLARLRWHFEPLRAQDVMVFADERDSPLLPKVGYTWSPQGARETGRTPGQQAQPYVAGALNLATGQVVHGLGLRKHNGLLRALLTRVDQAYPTPRLQRLSVVVDTSSMHKAKAVEQWLMSPPRFPLLFVPTYWPRANPIERLVGDVHDTWTRNHKRKRLYHRLRDVERSRHGHGPWPYQLSQGYYEPAITAAVETMASKVTSKVAA